MLEDISVTYDSESSKATLIDSKNKDMSLETSVTGFLYKRLKCGQAEGG